MTIERFRLRYVLIFLLGLGIFIYGCSRNKDYEEKTELIKFYRVEEFKVSGEKITVSVFINDPMSVSKRVSEDLPMYELVLSQGSDTLHKKFATDLQPRFLTGDSVYWWYDRWMLKK